MIAAQLKILSHSPKEAVQELLSALRRKDVQGIHCYLTSRRTSKKMIKKFLKNLRSFRSKNNVMFLDKGQETMSLVYMSKESESVALAMLESLLSYVMGTKVQTSSTGWSLVSKLVQSKKASYQGTEINLNEFKKADAVLQMSQEDDIQADEFMNHLKNMDSSIQNLEGVLVQAVN